MSTQCTNKCLGLLLLWVKSDYKISEQGLHSESIENTLNNLPLINVRPTPGKPKGAPHL